jgi:hypothetical protein
MAWCSVKNAQGQLYLYLYLNLKTLYTLLFTEIVIVTGYRLEDRDSIPGGDTDFLLFATTSRSAQGLKEPSPKWMLGAVSLGEKWLEHQSGHSPPSIAEV